MDFVAEARAAESRIRPYIRCTAVDRCSYLSQRWSAEVYLKHEHHQLTGSFKLRGAMNRILVLTHEERSQGVICASTGNHGKAVAHAAMQHGISALVYLPKHTLPEKQAAIKNLGADIVPVDGDCLAAELIARRAAEAQGRVFISPYNDPFVIAGQGTIGIELEEQITDLDAIFIAVGGGGLISGVAGYLKVIQPRLRVIGCWPQNAPAMRACLEAGQIIEVPEQPTLSESTAGGVEPGSHTFELCRQYIDDHVLVSEHEIRQAMRIIAEQERWIVEGAAGAAVAAFIKSAARYEKQKVAIILCGRNIALDTFQQALKLAAG